MVLPTTITPGFAGHIGDHEEIHSILDDIDNTNEFKIAQAQQGTLGARPAAGIFGRMYFASDIPLLFFDTGAAWQPLGTRIRRQDIISTGNLTLTTSEQDVPGTEFTITTVLSNARWLAWATFDFEWTTANNHALGVLYANGASQGEQAIYRPTTSGDRATVSQHYGGLAASPGAYTFKLRASKGSSTGVGTCVAGHTTLVVTMIEGNVS